MENLYDKALDAIRELFNDKSVSQEQKLGDMHALINEIEVMLESLDV